MAIPASGTTRGDRAIGPARAVVKRGKPDLSA
jgi:hypothetical protein